MVTADDVAKVVAGRLALQSGSLPGGGWFGRAPDEPAGYPYAVFRVEPQEAEFHTGDRYTQKFRVRAVVFTAQGQAGNDANVAAQTLQTALGTQAANAAMMATALRNATEKIVGVLPSLPGQGEYESILRSARDVFASALTVEVLVQGDRSVS